MLSVKSKTKSRNRNQVEKSVFNTSDGMWLQRRVTTLIHIMAQTGEREELVDALKSIDNELAIRIVRNWKNLVAQNGFGDEDQTEELAFVIDCLKEAKEEELLIPA